MKFTFAQTPDGTLSELWREFFGLITQVERLDKVIANVSIATSETPIAHGLGFAPQMAVPVPHSNVTIWRTKEPDAQCVYLAASGACVADVKVVP